MSKSNGASQIRDLDFLRREKARKQGPSAPPAGQEGGIKKDADHPRSGVKKHAGLQLGSGRPEAGGGPAEPGRTRASEPRGVRWLTVNIVRLADDGMSFRRRLLKAEKVQEYRIKLIKKAAGLSTEIYKQ